MSEKNVKPGAGSTGPRSIVSAERRNGRDYSNSHLQKQRSVVEEIERVRSALAFIDPRDHDTWLRVMMGIASEFGEDGWQIFDEWSRDAENYDARENRARWKSMKPGGGVTIATVFGIARAAGWPDDGRYIVPDPEELARRKRERATTDVEAAEKRDRAAAESAKKARAIWSYAGPATADHSYARRKRIGPTETLRQIDVEQAEKILGYAPAAGGVRLQGRVLVAPIKVGGKLSSLQLIDGAGAKHFLADGVIRGGFWASERMPDGDGTGMVVLIGEGVATVSSARQAKPTALGVAAMSNGNIPKVARQLRERYPGADLVILADLDKTTGTSDRHAVEAAAGVRGRLAVPQFDDGPAKDRKDFNDMLRVHGAEAVRETIDACTESAEQAGTNDANSEWPEPQPLVSKIEPEPYPLDALPDNIRQSVEEVADYVKAPLALVASSAISALSLTCQPFIDVRRDNRLVGPVAVYQLSIAESGERKTTLDNLFNTPLREWQQARAVEMKPKIDAFKSAHAAWLAECEGVRGAIKDSAKRGKATADLKVRLEQLTETEPRGPRVPSLFLGDETPENLAWRLYSQWPSAGLISSEAGVVFGGHAMSADKVLGYLALLNILWDGGEHSVGRKTSQSFTVRGARLTCGLQVQQAALLDFIEREGTLARGTGFWARFLISWPTSTIGTRFYREPGPMPALGAFQNRLGALLKLPVPLQDDGTLKPATAHLDPEATAAFVTYYNEVEKELREGGELEDVRDVAAKSAENAARLAALFQAFETDPTADGLTITADNFGRASRIAAWHLSEARRFFGELAMPQDLADAARLEAWLIERCRSERSAAVRKNHVRQFAPGRRLRDSKHLDGALKALIDLDRVRVTEARPITIELNPALLRGQA